MSWLLWIGFWVAAYFAGGLLTLVSLQRLVPTWYYEKADARGTEAPKWKPGFMDDGFAVALTVIFWPFAWFGAVVAVVNRANLNAMNDGLRLRSELERELAAARKEVDALLRKEGL